MIERKYGGGDLKPILLATEGATNIPFHEFYQMVEEAEAITSDRLEAWQKVAVALGYPEWQVDIKPEPVKIPYALKKKNKRKLSLENYAENVMITVLWAEPNGVDNYFTKKGRNLTYSAYML